MGPHHPAQLAIPVAVAFLAVSRHPAKSGQSGADPVVTAAAALGDFLGHPSMAPPARSESHQRRPCGRMALSAAAQAAVRRRREVGKMGQPELVIQDM